MCRSPSLNKLVNILEEIHTEKTIVYQPLYEVKETFNYIDIDPIENEYVEESSPENGILFFINSNNVEEVNIFRTIVCTLKSLVNWCI